MEPGRRPQEAHDGVDAGALAATELAPGRASGTRAGPLSRDAEGLADTAAIGEPSLSSSASPEARVAVSSELPHLAGPDRFETGARIGSGGMGEVVLQHDRNIGRAVAKKMLHPEMHGDVSLQRFIREARVQGQLEHPAVVPVHDFGVDADGRLFFSMKRVRGQTLAQILERLAVRDGEALAKHSRHKLLSAFVQVCLAIEYAHKRGVIHRDLKPSNVMLGDFGEVYVLDWGLAKLTSRGGDERVGEVAGSPTPSLLPPPRPSSPEMTSDGDFLGTPLYMAPELLLGRHTGTDERLDVFGLGAILFEILTLEPYRRGTTLAALVADVEATTPVERPGERVADVPAELDELCASALARDPSRRLASARALADAVTRYLEGDRDLVARRAQAAELVASARARLDAPGAARADEVVLATREVLKALALSPGDTDAQRLLVACVLEGSSDLSPEAARAFAERDVDVRVQGLRRGIAGFFLWLCAFPLAILVGIREWWLLVTLALLTVGCIAVSALLLRSRAASRSRAAPVALALLSGVVVALGSAWLGPFVLTPLAACAASTMFLVHATREETPPVLGVWLAVTAIPFAVEWFHLVPPAYAFHGGEIVLHARMLALPEGPTLLFLAYTSLSFVGFLGYFVAQLRGKQRDAERRLFGQAWLLQRLFPGDGGAAAVDERSP
jgi:serine/threonine-protein kinase